MLMDADEPGFSPGNVLEKNLVLCLGKTDPSPDVEIRWFEREADLIGEFGRVVAGCGPCGPARLASGPARFRPGPRVLLSRGSLPASANRRSGASPTAAHPHGWRWGKGAPNATRGVRSADTHD